tara:strand:- start:1164 stop:2333 length:1170 start_codon:yes stop_codon:yes gene_type:complete
MSIVVSYRRTPYGRLLGALSSVKAVDLGSQVLAASLADANISPDEVDYVVAGQVLQAGQGQNPARQVAVAAGIPLSVPAITINAVCLSGIEAIAHAHRLISSGEASIVACVGQESMSLAPHLLMNSRAGAKYGSIEVLDSAEIDGLTDAFESCSMGLSTENGNTQRGLTRAEQDSWAAQSHSRASQNAAFLDGEILPITVKVGKKELVVDQDEGIRPETTTESLSSLRPAFSPEGTITAGNASPISDGAACIIVVSEEEFARRAIPGLARILSHALVAGPDTQLHSQPSQAILAALAKSGRSIEECVALEINEAFASVVIQSMRDLDVDKSLVNRNGGAIALGHPIGSSGIRIVGTLARQLTTEGSGALGAAGICGGGGQGSAMVLEAL